MTIIEINKERILQMNFEVEMKRLDNKEYTDKEIMLIQEIFIKQYFLSIT